MKVEVNIMKLGFTLRDIKVGEKATIGEVSINVQYSAEELVSEYTLFKQALKELPEIVADLGAGALAFDKMDKAFDGLLESKIAEGATEESKQSAINKVMTVVSELKNAGEQTA
jgi:hypothetical protein